jgi:hypothetical protein
MTTPGEFGPAIDVSRTGDIGRTGGMPNVEIHPNTAMQYVSRFLGQSIGAPSSLIPGLSNDAILQQGKAAAIDLAHGIQAQMDAAGSDFLSSVREAASLMHDAAKANLAASKGMTAAASGGNNTANLASAGRSGGAHPNTATAAPAPWTGTPGDSPAAKATRAGVASRVAPPAHPNTATDSAPSVEDQATVDAAKAAEYNTPDPRGYSRYYFNGDGQLRETMSFSEGMGHTDHITKALWRPLAHKLEGYQYGKKDPALVKGPDGKFYHPGVDINTPGPLASAKELSRFEHNSRVTGTIQGFGARLETGGLLRALPLGELGMAYGAARMVYGQYMNQVQANTAVRAEEGPMSNMAAITERTRGTMFHLSALGTFTGKQASELFNGATESGFRGGARNNALDLATEQFKRNGTSIKQTLDIMAIAAETGGKALNGVNDALDSVSQMAKDTGVSAKALRDNFINNYQAIGVTQGTGTASTAQLAAADTAATAGQGARFTGLSAAGMSSEVNNRRQAAAMGMSYGTFLAKSGQDSSIRAKAQEKMLFGASVSNTTAEQRQWIQSQIANLRKDKYGKVSDDALNAIGDQAQEKFGLDPSAIGRAMSAETGISGITADNASSYLVHALSGAANPVKTLDENKKNSVGRQLTKEERTKNGSLEGGDNGTNYDLAFEKSIHKTAANTRQNWHSGDLSSPIAQYERQIKITGKTSPVIEKLLSENLSGRMKEMYQVKTKNGMRDVRLADAIRGFQDQLETGNVKIVGGGDNGKTISQLTSGLGTGGDIGTTGSAQRGTPTGGHGGIDANSDKARKSEGAGGTVTLQLTADAAKVLKVYSSTGNVAIANGAATGTPPAQVNSVQEKPH